MQTTEVGQNSEIKQVIRQPLHDEQQVYEFYAR